jgi:hypothetical protein
MELSSSWETANSATTQQTVCILQSPKVHHRSHNSPPLIYILSQISPAHTTPILYFQDSFQYYPPI